MSKFHIYCCKDGRATIYYSKEYPKSLGIRTTEYDGEIPEGSGVLKFNGESLYYEPFKDAE